MDELDNKNGILVKVSADQDKNSEKKLPLLRRLPFVGEIKNPYAWKYGTKVFLLKGAKVSVNQISEAGDTAKKELTGKGVGAWNQLENKLAYCFRFLVFCNNYRKRKTAIN